MADIGPSPRVYGVCLREDAVLLVKARRTNDDRDLWWLPGGGIDFGESLDEALEREFLEETGLTVTQHHIFGAVADLRTRANGDRMHTVRVLALVIVADGAITHEADGTTSGAEWVPLTELPRRRLAPYAERAIADAQALLAGAAQDLTAFRRWSLPD